jgi:hypothetical protein
LRPDLFFSQKHGIGNVQAMTNPLEQRLEADLAAIRIAIANGQAEDAARKMGAISLNISPGNRLAREIGDLYLELGFPAMAGRYWYLVESKSDQMIAACKEFEHSLGNTPTLILDALGSPANPSATVKARLVELHRRARDFRREFQYDVKPARGLRDRLALLGCAIVCFILMFISISGIWFITTWFR